MRSLLELSLTGTLKVISASETACHLHEMHEVLLEYSHVEFSKTWCGCQAAPALSIIDHRRPFRHLQDMIIVQSHSWLGRRPFDTKVDLQVLCGEQLFRRKKKVCLSSYYCLNLSTHPICIHLPILARTTTPTTATARGKLLQQQRQH